MSELATPPIHGGAPPLLEAREVRKTYRMGRFDVEVLRGASLRVQPGEWVAIIGASGSGKSTLLHLLGDLDRDDSGGSGVLHRGRAMDTLSPLERNAYRNRTIGFVFQFYHLLPELTVLENTMLPSLVRDSLRPASYWLGVTAGGAVLGAATALGVGRIWPALYPDAIGGAVAAAAGALVIGAALAPAVVSEVRALAGRFSDEHRQRRDRAADLLERFGLGPRLRHRPRELSGGERQRVAIARALLNTPDALLADEPTGNLDEHTGAEILDLLAVQHQAGMAIVMVTHDPQIAARADRVVRLRDGIVEEEQRRG